MEDEQTKDALLRIVDECFQNPAKKKEFVKEGTVGLLIELCRSKKKCGIKGYAAAALAVICHQNDDGKSDLLELGGCQTFLSLCRPLDPSIENQSPTIEKLFCHEQAAALLQKLTFNNPACQQHLVNAGIVRNFIQLCDVFNPDGSHDNCCHGKYSYSKEAKKALQDLALNKKLIGNVTKLLSSKASKELTSLFQSGADVHSFGQELDCIYKVELYDTTTSIDIRICKEMISKGLVWPDSNYMKEHIVDERNKSPQKEDKGGWSDISLMSVIDAGHFWAHVGGDIVKKKLQEIQEGLNSQQLVSVSTTPLPGTMVCSQEISNGNAMLYRGRVLDVTSIGDSSKAKIFAVDYGFTAVLPVNNLYSLPQHLLEIPPQVSLCCLAGVQPPPENPSVLEYTAGALRNLCEIDEDFIMYVVTSGGIEALLKLCIIPNKRIILQAIAALTNIGLDFRFRARVGFLGGIKIFLNLCLQYEQDDDILLAAVSAVQSVLSNSAINCGRTLQAKGLDTLIHVYLNTTSEQVQNCVLRALKNLIGRVDSSQHQLDMRSIVDDMPNKMVKYKLDVQRDEGYRQHSERIERSRRRRARRNGRTFSDQKPTLVAMTMDDLSKQSSDTSDSASDCDSDERYASRWTSETDVDTDGEMLIKDSSKDKIPNYINKPTETPPSERYYVQTHYMSCIEDESHEFCSQTNVHDISKRKVAKTLCGFLNNKKTGTIYIGVRNSGEICGIRVKRHERDLLRQGIDEMVDNFKPPLKPDMYKMDFIPLARPSGSSSVVSRQMIEDRYVIEIQLVKYTGLIYTTPKGKCYFRHKSANIELTTQEVRERTIQEQEASYNDEIKRLRKELRDMRKLMKPTNNSDMKSTTKLEVTASTPDHIPKQEIKEAISPEVETGCVVM